VWVVMMMMMMMGDDDDDDDEDLRESFWAFWQMGVCLGKWAFWQKKKAFSLSLISFLSLISCLSHTHTHNSLSIALLLCQSFLS